MLRMFARVLGSAADVNTGKADDVLGRDRRRSARIVAEA